MNLANAWKTSLGKYELYNQTLSFEMLLGWICFQRAPPPQVHQLAYAWAYIIANVSMTHILRQDAVEHISLIYAIWNLLTLNLEAAIAIKNTSVVHYQPRKTSLAYNAQVSLNLGWGRMKLRPRHFTPRNSMKVLRWKEAKNIFNLILCRLADFSASRTAFIHLLYQSENKQKHVRI